MRRVGRREFFWAMVIAAVSWARVAVLISGAHIRRPKEVR